MTFTQAILVALARKVGWVQATRLQYVATLFDGNIFDLLNDPWMGDKINTQELWAKAAAIQEQNERAYCLLNGIRNDRSIGELWKI